MNTIIRTHGVVSLVVGWMLTGMGILAIATVIILSVFVEDWMIIFLFGPVLLFIGAAVNFWMGSRARLEITPDRFIWCGFIGRARSIAWHDVHRIVRPPPGSPPRLAAVAHLRDGSFVEVTALWKSPSWPTTYLSHQDHGRAQQALIDGHIAHLNRMSRGSRQQHGRQQPGWPQGQSGSPQR